MTGENNETLNPRTLALKEATLEIEKHVAKAGWDGPVRVFALVNAKKALAQTPELQENLALLHETNADSISEQTLFSVEQEGLPQSASLGELLSKIYWPDSVDGTAISVERVVLPPSAEVDLPQDEDAALKILQNHPARQEVRMVAALMRDGETWGALRMRKHDQDSMVLSGEKILDGLCTALAVTFEEFPETKA